MKKFALALFTLCLFTSVGWGAEGKKLSQVEEYDLSERCGKQAEVFFKIRFRLTNGNDPSPGSQYKDEDGQGFSSPRYSNHYNKKLNKCFIHTEEVHSDADQKITFSELSLDDVNEHKTYGEYLGDHIIMKKKPFQCYAFGNHCKSEDEWETLIKPYMEE